MKPTRLHTYFVGFVLAFGMLGVVTGLGWRQLQRVEETTASVLRAHQVLNQLNQVLSLVQDIENGARSFVVTGDAVFLEPFEAARADVDGEVQALVGLTADNPRQRRAGETLAPLIAERLAIAQHLVALRRSDGFEEAQEAVASGRGKTVMDEIRVVIARMTAEEQELLAHRSAEARREGRTNNLLIGSGAALALLLLIGTFPILRREHRLRQQSQAQLERFFTLSLDMLAIADLTGRFTRVSPAFTQTLGHSAAELLATPIIDFVHEDDREATLAAMKALRAGDSILHFENRYRCRDGSWRWLSWKTQPIAGEGLLYATARDVTDRRQAEERIRRLHADLQVRAGELASANKELESFSYSVSHDLRAPLRSIDGFSQILLEDCADQLGSEGKDALGRVRRAAATMGQLIDALLALSRVTRAELRVERVDLSQLAATIAAGLRHAQPDRKADFIIDPGMIVEGDPVLLRVALENLLENAWKYTRPRETARIEFGCVDRGGEEVYCVRDNGVGFDMAYVHMLFRAFQRLHRQADFGGTGIGLATVQRVVHRHNGRVWAEGRVDCGAAFYFTLPDEAERTPA